MLVSSYSFDITELIYRVPNFLSDDECDSLILNMRNVPVSFRWNNALMLILVSILSLLSRGISLLEGTKNYDLLFRKTEQAVNEYMDYLESKGSFHMPLMRRSLNYSHMYRLLKYGPGNKIHPHTDHDPLTYGSVTFNLNDDYTGGEFKFFNGKYTVKLKRGEMMIWLQIIIGYTKLHQLKLGIDIVQIVFCYLSVPNSRMS